MQKAEIERLKAEIKKTGRFSDFKGLIPPVGYTNEFWGVDWNAWGEDRDDPIHETKTKSFRNPFKALKFALTIDHENLIDAAWSGNKGNKI